MSRITAEIINIGDEILIGQIVNTNAVWLAARFSEIGLPVGRMTTVADTEIAITEAIDKAIADHTIIIITGGLGPTKDDVTKKTLCDYFNCGLTFHEEIKDRLEAFFRSRNRELNEPNRTQAYLPDACIPLYNDWGTAPGMWFEKDGKILVSLPGVPHEMKNLITHRVLPRLMTLFPMPPLTHRTFLTMGIPESELMQIIADWENALPPSVKLAYLPTAAEVKLRLTSMNTDGQAEALMDQLQIKLYELIGHEIYGTGDDTPENVIRKLLAERQMTLATAESCTGGYIAHKITSVPGSSEIYMGSVVAYDNRIKIHHLGVSEETLIRYGAVSGPVVEEMALNLKRMYEVDYTIAVSGIAGPGGGTEEKPVGTVWVAWATPQGVLSKKFLFGNDRLGNIHRTYQYSLNILRKLILGLPLKSPATPG